LAGSGDHRGEQAAQLGVDHVGLRNLLFRCQIGRDQIDAIKESIAGSINDSCDIGLQFDGIRALAATREQSLNEPMKYLIGIIGSRQASIPGTASSRDRINHRRVIPRRPKTTDGSWRKAFERQNE
jgi:hypothetical protein